LTPFFFKLCLNFCKITPVRTCRRLQSIRYSWKRAIITAWSSDFEKNPILSKQNRKQTKFVSWPVPEKIENIIFEKCVFFIYYRNRFASRFQSFLSDIQKLPDYFLESIRGLHLENSIKGSTKFPNKCLFCKNIKNFSFRINQKKFNKKCSKQFVNNKDRTKKKRFFFQIENWNFKNFENKNKNFEKNNQKFWKKKSTNLKKKSQMFTIFQKKNHVQKFWKKKSKTIEKFEKKTIFSRKFSK